MRFQVGPIEALLTTPTPTPTPKILGDGDEITADWVGTAVVAAGAPDRIRQPFENVAAATQQLDADGDLTRKAKERRAARLLSDFARTAFSEGKR